MRLIGKYETISKLMIYAANSETAFDIEDAERIVQSIEEVDPVHAAGGCYCRECRMRTGVETKETVLCGYHGCSMRKDDFCSMGKREETKDEKVSVL